MAAKLGEYKVKREAIAKEKAEVRTALDQHGRTITADLGTAINTYRLEDLEDFVVERSKMSTSQF